MSVNKRQLKCSKTSTCVEKCKHSIDHDESICDRIYDEWCEIAGTWGQCRPVTKEVLLKASIEVKSDVKVKDE